MTDCAVKLFLERGIERTTVTDLARELKVGEATIYRYYGKRQNVVLEAAISLWKYVDREYLATISGRTGKEKIQAFFSRFVTIYEEHLVFCRFVAEFDSYLLKENFTEEQLAPYEALFLPMFARFSSYYEEGLADGSLKRRTDISSYYAMSTHALLSLCKKHAMGAIIASDELGDGRTEIGLLCEALLNYLVN